MHDFYRKGTVRFLWPLLLVGVAVSFPLGVETLLPSLLAAASLWLMLIIVRPRSTDSLPVWILLLTFGWGYFAKSWLMVILDPYDVEERLDYPANVLFSDEALFYKAFTLTCVAFSVFCFSTIIAGLANRQGARKPTVAALEWQPRRTVWTIATVWSGMMILLAFTGYIQYTYELAVMGTDNVALPFRLSGVIVYFRTVFAPQILLVLYHLASEQRLDGWKRVVVASVVVHGSVQSLLMSSRGVLLMMLLPLFFYSILRGSITRRMLFAGAGMLIVVAAAHPLVTELRWYRVEYGRDSLGEALTTTLESYDPIDAIGSGLSGIAFRFTGTDGLLTALDAGDIGLSFSRLQELLFDEERSFSRIFTQDIAGYGDIQTHQNAPGLLGAFCSLGGIAGTLLGISIWTAVLLGLWRWRRIVALSTGQPTQAGLAMWMLILSEAGTLEIIPSRLIVFSCAVLLGEAIARRCLVANTPWPSGSGFASQDVSLGPRRLTRANRIAQFTHRG